MQRSLWASLRLFNGIKRCSLISSTWNTSRSSRTDLAKFKMHKGGIRNKSEFSRGGYRRGGGDRRGGGRRGGHGGHPSGLSGKEIGLWHAARGKRKRIDRELKQRAYVTMKSHHEEKITELLDKMRADESNELNYSGAGAGTSRHGDQFDMLQEGSYDTDEIMTDFDSKDSGPSTHRDWYDTPQEWTYQRDEMNADEASAYTVNTATFGSQFTDEADQVSYQSPGELLVPGECCFNQTQSGHKCLQQDPVLDHYLKEERQRKLLSNQGRYKKMQEFRKRLPAHDKKEELLQLINSEQVLVISGETGCGKTTQVAQFILDDAIEQGRGSLCRVICTQPRRISAISVAERVAAERDESCGGNSSVGFQIRLESKLPREQGSILYCTTGILLRWLVSDPLLLGASHIILDEIHERDVLSDFLIIIVRDLLPKRPDLKLILMSATLNSQMFSAYFGNCTMCHIPGFTYPVQEFYLEEIIEKTGYHVTQRQNNNQKREPKWKQHIRRKSSAKDRRLEKSMAWLAESQEDDEEMLWQGYLNSIRDRFSPRTITTLQNMDLEMIDNDLLVTVIRHISFHMEEGAILVFLPGWDDISKLHENLKQERFFSSVI